MKKVTKEELKWHSFEEVFARLNKNKDFRKAYAAEMARRKLATQIRELRVAKRLTQKMVAQKAGMPQSVIARIESGERGMSVDTLGRIAHSFGMEIQLR